MFLEIKNLENIAVLRLFGPNDWIRTIGKEASIQDFPMANERSSMSTQRREKNARKHSPR